MSATTKSVLIGIALVLAGCTPREKPPEPKLNTALWREVFMECLQKAPAGPQAAKYNDWAEVVSECRSVTYYMALEQP